MFQNRAVHEELYEEVEANDQLIVVSFYNLVPSKLEISTRYYIYIQYFVTTLQEVHKGFMSFMKSLWSLVSHESQHHFLYVYLAIYYYLSLMIWLFIETIGLGTVG